MTDETGTGDTLAQQASPGDLFAVIPAGGSGTRLWPLSREHAPKFLHPLTGNDRSLLQATFDRLLPLVPVERIFLVTGAAHVAAVARQLPDLPAENILVEPTPRDSAAAIALATGVIASRAPDALVASFAADHLIVDPDAFRRTVRTAVTGARQGLLMTIGITPTRPDTGYGYLECQRVPGAGTVAPVRQFREKPPADLAADYVAAGNYLWNAGMFVWQASTFLAQLAEQRPGVAEPVARIVAGWDGPDREEVLAAEWPHVEKVAVDYAVMEPASAQGLVGTVAGDFGWSDIGDFEAVAAVLGRDGDGTTVVDAGGRPGPVVTLDSERLIVVPAAGRAVATLGVQDLIIVDTDDAVLVCRRDRAQDIKAITTLLKQVGADAFA